MTVKDLETQIEKLRIDREARLARLAEIEPQLEELRPQLRSKRGEAALGSAAAGKRAEKLSEDVRLLEAEAEGLTAAIELLDVEIEKGATDLRAAVDARNAVVVERCRVAMLEARAAYDAAMAAIVGPMQRAAAARYIARQHGGDLPSLEDDRRRLVIATQEIVSWKGVSKNIRHVEPAMTGVPAALLEPGFSAGRAEAIASLAAEIAAERVEMLPIAPPGESPPDKLPYVERHPPRDAGPRPVSFALHR